MIKTSRSLRHSRIETNHTDCIVDEGHQMTSVKPSSQCLAATHTPHTCSSSLGSDLSVSTISDRTSTRWLDTAPYLVAGRHHFKSNQLSHRLQMIQLSGRSTGCDPWPVNGDTLDKARCVERTSGLQSQCCTVSVNVLSRRVD
jgi:hypothetical protein